MMSSFLARVVISLKPTVNDPQCLTIMGSLHSLGFSSVSSTRAGKFIEVSLEAQNKEEAGEAVEEMCHKLLANPIIEDFRYDIEEREPA